MKTILITHPSNDLYGSDRILVSALSALPAEYIKVVVLPKEGPLTELLEENVTNLRVVIAPSLPIICRDRYTLKGIFGLVNDYRECKALIQKLHLIYDFSFAYHNTMATTMLSRITNRIGIPTAMHCHEILESPRLPVRAIHKMAARNSDLIICVSQAVRRNLAKDLGESSKLRVVRNGIDPIYASANRLKEKVRFLLIGRITPNKGQWFLMDALKHVSPDILEQCEFRMVGGTVPGQEFLEDDLNERIEGSQQGLVNLAPFSRDISAHMSWANVVLVPSLMKDPFPTTVIEAMSASRPVIVTNHGGAKEIVQPEWNGLQVAPDDAKGLASAIEYYVKNSLSVSLHGSRGQKLYQDELTKKRFHQNLVNLLSEHFGLNASYHKLHRVA